LFSFNSRKPANKRLACITAGLQFQVQPTGNCNFISTEALTAPGSLQFLYFAALIKLE